jgi:hypothetical protein
LKGHFKLRISSLMKPASQIEKYAQEPVAYYLHKRRDFLHRLLCNRDQHEDKDILEYTQILKFIAGESPEGR